MFTTASLAARIERAEAGMILECVRAAERRLPPEQAIAREINGGVAAYVEPGAPFNKVAGVGFDGVPAADVLDDIERQFEARQAPLQFEVSTLADPELARTLTSRGYQLVGFENVLGLALRAASEGKAGPADIEVTPAAPEEAYIWMATVITGFETPDVFDGPPTHESFARETLERVFGDTLAAAGFERFIARRKGTIAGGASFRIQDGVAQLNGAATLPAHRRQGVQTALLRYRLHEAMTRGCDVAVVTTQPGSKSQENVEKAGFSLLYARAILIRQ